MLYVIANAILIVQQVIHIKNGLMINDTWLMIHANKSAKSINTYTKGNSCDASTCICQDSICYKYSIDKYDKYYVNKCHKYYVNKFRW